MCTDMPAHSQEVSEMLGGKISNQDEEEVEDELAALEAELTQQTPLPDVPNHKLPTNENKPVTEPVKAEEPERQAMLAA